MGFWSSCVVAAFGVFCFGAQALGEVGAWKAGLARVKITPEGPVWMAGYASRTRPAEGTLHDLWVKVLALEDAEGRRVVLVTTDLLGVPKSLYEPVAAELKRRYGLERDQVMLTSSHTHCGPVVRDALIDAYPVDEQNVAAIEAYSRALEGRIVSAVGEALERLAPATLAAGEGTATFAVNRRNNKEAEVPALRAAGTPLKGPVDHSVPVLAVRGAGGELRAVVFGYACHNTTLNFYQWCGDYAGFAQIELERKFPKAQAMFWQGCGADQNPLPRRKVELAEGYGRRLAESVEAALAGPVRELSPRVRTAFEFVPLAFEHTLTEAELKKAAADEGATGRRARRLLELRRRDGGLPPSHPCPVQAWRLGDQLLIALGGEVVVDYALKFKERFGPTTWVAGYANDVFAYVPSRRVWEEGGYECGAFMYYGLPTDRWAGDIEDRLTAGVGRVVKAVSE